MDQRTQWQLRYRSPNSPTRGVDDVIIETETNSEADAKALADWWLATKVPSPSTRFVYVRRLVVATMAEMRAAQTARPGPVGDEDADRGGNPAQAASRDPSVPATPTGDGSEDSPRNRRGAVPLGRVGA